MKKSEAELRKEFDDFSKRSRVGDKPVSTDVVRSEPQQTSDEVLVKESTPRFVSPGRFLFTNRAKEKAPTLPSKTVPDETLSIREILERFSSGRPLSKVSHNEPIYVDDMTFDDEDLEKVRDMDLTEKQELSERTQVIRAQGERLQKQAADKQRKREDDEKREREQMLNDYREAKKQKEQTDPSKGGDTKKP